jgi:hypothetical protein
MNRKSLVSAGTPACLALQLAMLSWPAFAGDALGALGGITRDSKGEQPVPETSIVVRAVATDTVRSAITAPDGTFSINDLRPGQYEVTASRPGFAESHTRVEVAALRVSQLTFLLAADAAAPAANASPAVPLTPTAIESELEALKGTNQPIRGAAQDSECRCVGGRPGQGAGPECGSSDAKAPGSSGSVQFSPSGRNAAGGFSSEPGAGGSGRRYTNSLRRRGLDLAERQLPAEGFSARYEVLHWRVPRRHALRG